MRRFTSSRSHETTSGRAVFSEDDAARPWQADLPCAQISPGRFSMMNCRPNRLDSHCAMMRNDPCAWFSARAAYGGQLNCPESRRRFWRSRL